MVRRKYKFVSSFIIAVVLLALVYQNHFDNGFYFDDKHTIEENTSITKLDILSFFTDAKTFSSYPDNQAYRPITTLENAIDYKIGDGLNSFTFHIHIFIVFIALGVSIYFLVFYILNKHFLLKHKEKIALLTSLTFSFLCANAETVNYIIQRAEITAALSVVLGLLFYIKNGILKKSYFYLLFPFLGFFAKEMAFTFPFILFVYILVFEEKVYLFSLNNSSNFKGLIQTIKKSLPAFLLMIAYYFLIYKQVISKTYTPGGTSAIHYFITQPMVILHYIITYFFPYNLSIDSDWKVYQSIFDYRVIIGFVVNIAILFMVVKLSKLKNYKLFSFGMLWFYVTLIPTSTIIPFAEVMNSHRTFLPYIGLTIAFIGLLVNFYNKLIQTINIKKVNVLASAFLFVFFASNIYGIRQRNAVWNSDYNLWKDAAVKAPESPRTQMNFAVILMEKGKYSEAEQYLKKALKISPNYHFIYINLSVIASNTGKMTKAKKYIEKAISLNPNHVTLYFYAKFFKQNNQLQKAEEQLKKSIAISNNYSKSLNLLLDIYRETNQFDKLRNLSLDILNNDPSNKKANLSLEYLKNTEEKLFALRKEIVNQPTPQNYLSLSLMYYNLKQYKEAKNASLEAIKLKSDYAEAYNNLGISNYKLNNYFDAISAYEKALELNPNYQLAKNNLQEVKESKTKIRDFYINQSLIYFNNGDFENSISSAKKSIEIIPSSIAYNNICAAYNQLKNYNEAIVACKKALELDTNNTLAKGNLNLALKNNSK